MADMVHRPPHYIVDNYETIDILKAYFPNDPLMWNAGKYFLRAGRKGDMVMDIDKCIFYLQEKKRAIKEAEPESINPPEIAAQLQRLEMADD